MSSKSPPAPPSENPVRAMRKKLKFNIKLDPAGFPPPRTIHIQDASRPSDPVKVDFTWDDPDMSLLLNQKPKAPAFRTPSVKAAVVVPTGCQAAICRG